MRPRFRPLSLILCLAPACQAPQADTSSFTTMQPRTSGPADSTGSSSGTTNVDSGDASTTTTTTTGNSSTTSDGVSTTLILDVGSDMDLGDGKPIGCKGKIDFLFVISRMPGMGYFQTQLLAAFPQFIATIEAKFSDFDYHIIVVDGDPFWGADGCDFKCPVQCVPGYPCGHTPGICDTTMGAGVVFPAGPDAPNKVCPINGGRRYMIKGQTDLEQTFACAAQVGSGGWGAMGEALMFAAQPEINAPGGCNAGFLRDDALLMVTIISNTFDVEGAPGSSQMGTPATWMQAVREAKHGDLESVVILGILGTEGPGCDEDDRICQMLPLFPFALNRDIAAADHGPFFEEATDLVATACAQFTPPG